MMRSRHAIYCRVDLLYPRRPYGQQPKAIEVDKRLQNLLPELVKAVRIE